MSFLMRDYSFYTKKSTGISSFWTVRFALSELKGVKELFDLLDVFGKGSGGEGEKKHNKNQCSEQLSPPIERCDVIDGRWMTKAEEDDEDQKEEPTGVVKYGDKGHHNNSDQINGSTFSSK